MVVSIKSLRIASDLDASGYERGAQAIVSANSEMATSAQRVGVSIKETETKISVAGAGIAKLEAKFVPAARQAREFERYLRQINGALEKDATETERMSVVLAAMQGRLKMSADAAQLAASGYGQLAIAVDNANAMMRAQDAERYAARLQELRTKFDGAHVAAIALNSELSELAELERSGIQITGGYEQALNSLILKYDATAQAAKRMADEQAQVIARARAEQQALNSQQNINSLTGVRSFQAGTARDSASVFAAAAEEADRLDQSVARLRAAINPLGAAQNRLNAEMAEYDTLARSNLISTNELIQAQALAQARYNATAEAIERDRAANDNGRGLPSYQLRNLMYQGTDLAQGLALGMPIQQVLMQQGPQLFDALSSGAGGLTGGLRALIGMVSPLAAGFTAIAAGAGIGAKALSDYLASVKAVEVASAGLGRATAGTAQQMEAAAEAGAAAADISISAARSMEVQFLRTGKIGAQNFEGLIGISKNFAATFGTDLENASRTLTDLFADPAQGAQQLYRQYGLIEAATASYIQRLAAQNRVSEAQNVLLTALPQRLALASEATTAFGRAWDKVTTSASNAWDAIGRGVDSALSAPSIDDQIREAAKELERFRNAGQTFSFFGSMTGVERGEREASQKLDDLIEQRRRLQALEADRARTSVNTGLIVKAQDIANLASANDELRTMKDLEDQIAAIRIGIGAARNSNGGVSSSQIDDLERAENALTRAKETRIPAMQKEQQLAELDLRISNERNPVLRSGLAAEREKLRLAGEVITTEEAATRTAAARNQVMRETLATSSSQLQDMQAEIEVRRQLAGQVDSGQITLGEANRRMQEELALRPLIAASAAAEGEEKQRLLTMIDELRRAYGDLADSQKISSAQQIVQGQEERLRSLQMEISLVGQVGGERRRAMAIMEAEIQIQREGIKADSERAQTIRANAAAIAELTDTLSVQQALGDLKFQGEQIGRTREDQQVYEQLRQLGLDINSSDGRRVTDAIRLNQQLEQQRELVDQMSSTLAGMFSQPIKDADDFISKLAGGFASIGQANLQKTFNSILGGGLGGLGSTGAGSSTGSGLLTGLVSGIGKLFGASNGAADRSSMVSGRQLREVSTSLGQVNKSAMQVAQQFAGLNEKADSPVLDSFMMSSGTWSRLSAKDTAWCAAFANASIIQAGGQGTGSNLASSFLDWGMGTNNPQPGDIVVLKPQSAGSSGHVGFLAGYGNGKVQIFGGNQSNGVNIQTYDASEVRAFRTSADPNVLRSAVSSGMVDGIQQVQASGITRGVSQNTVSGSADGSKLTPGMSGAAGGAGGMGAFGSVLSAGLGGFGMGVQSQNPLMGALGGAMSGWSAGAAMGAAGGPIGAVIGGIAGLVGGIFGKKKQKKQELRQAQQELENQIGAIAELMRTATGNFMGVFEKEYTTVTDEFRKAMSLADKAKNYQLKDQLEAAMSGFFDQLTERWNRGFEGMLQGMETGQGLNGAFVSGMDSVEKMRESLIGFVNDAKMFSEANGDLAGYYAKSRTPAEPPILNQYQEYWRGYAGMSGGMDINEKNVLPEGYKNVADQMFNLGVAVWNDKGGALYNSLSELINAARDAGLEVDQLGMVTRKAVEPQQSYADSVERARQAAIKTALSTVEGASELSKFAEELQTLQGKAASLPALLRDLGMSAEDASKAVGSSLNYAITKLRDSFVSDITGSMADLNGVGYINDIMSALSQYETRLSDATLLGFDNSLPVRELSLSIRDIARQSDLTKDELALLSGAFPQLQFIFNGISTTSMTLSDATSQLDQAYREQTSELDRLIDASKQGITAIKRFRDEMRISDKSPLSPYQQLLEAQRQFQDISTKARAGDEDALGQLTQISQSYLDEAQSYYASSTEYYQIWTEVDRTLLELQTATEGTLSETEKQKAALDAQVKGIIDVNTSVLSVKDALDQYNRVNTETLSALKGSLDLLKITGANSVAAAFSQVNGRPGTQSELQYWQDQVANGRTIDQVKSAMSGPETQLLALYREVMGRDLDAAGRTFFLNSGKSMAEIRADLEWAKANGAMKMGGIVGAYANGGMVSNGLYNVDSVLARYAGGGNIALAGGEMVVRAPSVNSRTAPALDYINRTGSMPANDSSLAAEVRNLRQELASLKASMEKVAAVSAASGQVVAEAVGGTTGAVVALRKDIAVSGLKR